MTTKKEFSSLVSSAFEYSKKFSKKFGYSCELPYDDLNHHGKIALDEFQTIVDNSIKDDFDYTIEKYGTIPMPKGNVNDLLID